MKIFLIRMAVNHSDIFLALLNLNKFEYKRIIGPVKLNVQYLISNITWRHQIKRFWYLHLWIVFFILFFLNQFIYLDKNWAACHWPHYVCFRILWYWICLSYQSANTFLFTQFLSMCTDKISNVFCLNTSTGWLSLFQSPLKVSPF